MDVRDLGCRTIPTRDSNIYPKVELVFATEGFTRSMGFEPQTLLQQSKETTIIRELAKLLSKAQQATPGVVLPSCNIGKQICQGNKHLINLVHSQGGLTFARRFTHRPCPCRMPDERASVPG
jgi:hypothetical protein